MADLEKARQLFTDAGLAFPTVPDELAGKLQERGKWLFSTRELSISPYNLEYYAHEQHEGLGKEYALLSHSGHGVNSFAIQYYLVYGPLRMFLHLSWGGVYMNKDAAAAKIEQCFSLADQIVLTTMAGEKAGKDHQLTIQASDFYGSYWFGPGETLQKEKNGSYEPIEVLREALKWLTSGLS